MTQMGLEYMKLKESGRHNLADEGIRAQTNVISAQDANTRSYTASFKPQEVGISQEQARAATSQANTAAGRLGLDTQYRERETAAKEVTSESAKSQAESASGRLALDKGYRERETVVKEKQGDAATSQAQSAHKQAIASEMQALNAQERTDIENMKVILDHLSGPDAAQWAAKYGGSNNFNAQVSAFNSILEKLLPSTSIKYPAMFK